jgi:hypothetical protein
MGHIYYTYGRLLETEVIFADHTKLLADAFGYRIFHWVDISCGFFWRARVCWPLLCLLYVAHFVFLRDVWIQTQRPVQSIASRCAITHLPKLATHLPNLTTHLPNLAAHLPNLTTHLPNLANHLPDLAINLRGYRHVCPPHPLQKDMISGCSPSGHIIAGYSPGGGHACMIHPLWEPFLLATPLVGDHPYTPREITGPQPWC